MPLPDTPPSKDSNVYRQLSSSKAAEILNSDFDKVQNPVFIDPSSEDELRRINLVGQATNQQSQSGPIPNSMKIVTTTIDSSSKITVFQPEKGSVWQLQQASLTRDSGSGTTNIFIQYYDGTNEASALYVSTGSSELILTSDDNYAGNTYFVDNGVYFRVYRDSGSADYTLSTTFVRVR